MVVTLWPCPKHSAICLVALRVLAREQDGREVRTTSQVLRFTYSSYFARFDTERALQTSIRWHSIWIWSVSPFYFPVLGVLVLSFCQSQATGGMRVKAHADCWTTKTVPEATGWLPFVRHDFLRHARVRSLFGRCLNVLWILDGVVFKGRHFVNVDTLRGSH